MSNIVISGYYGFGNAGDEAMLAAIIETIVSVNPDVHITVISGSPQMTRTQHGVKAIGRFDMFGILQAIRQCDLLISGGGSLLQDVTSTRSLYYYLSIIKIAQMFNRKIMIYAQGIGPLHKKLARETVSKVLNNVTMITVRDEASKEELIQLGVTQVPIEVTADAVLSMHPVDSSIGKRLLKEYPLTGVHKKVGVSVRSWKMETAYQRELGKALDRLYEEDEVEIIFIPMQHPDDTNEARNIQSFMKSPSILLEKNFTTTELLALSSTVDVMIGVRLHALIFSSLMERPVVGITYDPKITNFLSMIGREPVGHLESLDGNTLVEAVKEALHEGLSKQQIETIRNLRDASARTGQIALELLDA